MLGSLDVRGRLLRRRASRGDLLFSELKDTAMEKLHLPRKILILLILFSTGFLSYWSFTQMQEALSQRTAARDRQIGTLQMMASRLTEAEAGQRGCICLHRV